MLIIALYYNTLRFFVIVKLSSMFIDLVELYPIYTISKIIKYENKCLYKKFKLIQTYICLRPTLCTLLTSIWSVRRGRKIVFIPIFTFGSGIGQFL